VVAIYLVDAAALCVLYDTLRLRRTGVDWWHNMLLVCFGHHAVTAVNIILLKSKRHRLHPQIICSVTIVVTAWGLSASASAQSSLSLLSIELSDSESKSLSVSESFKNVSTSFLVYDHFLLAMINYDARRQTIYWRRHFPRSRQI